MYFKILREDLAHHGFTYEEGINVDVKPFNPSPKCDGGLFFADEESILDFCDYGTKVAEVTVPEGEEIVQVGNKYKAHKIILGRIRDLWTADTFEWLAGCGVNMRDMEILCYATLNGYLNVVEYLIQSGTDIHTYNDCVLRWAAKYGYLDVIRLLLENEVNIHVCDDYALRMAAENGYADIVRLLLEKGADVHARNDWALCCAAYEGYADIVQLLINAGANVHACDDYAIRKAAENGHSEVVEILKESAATNF